MSQDTAVAYRLTVSVADGRVVLRGLSERGDEWTVSMLPAPTTQLILMLCEAVRAVESGEGPKP